MVVAVIAVRMMQPSVDQIVGMVTMRDCLVSAAGAVRMAGALDVRRAINRIVCAHRNDVLIDVVAVHVVQMTVMQIVDVAIVLDRRMPAARTMLMGMVGVLFVGAIGHGCFLDC